MNQKDLNKIIDIVNPKSGSNESAKLQYSIKLYIAIDNRLQHINKNNINIVNDVIFRSLFERLYCVGGGFDKLTQAQKNMFYMVFDKYRLYVINNTPFSINDINNDLKKIVGTNYVVYASKIYHTLDHTKVILDKNAKANIDYFYGTNFKYKKNSINLYNAYDADFNKFIANGKDGYVIWQQYKINKNAKGLNIIKAVDFVLWLFS